MLSLLLLPAVAHADWPLGTKLESGVIVDVTEPGLAELEALVGLFLPPRVEIPPVALADTVPPCLFGACVAEYAIAADNMFVEVAINDLSLVPDTGVLVLTADATLTVSTPAEPAAVDVYIEAATFTIIDDSCDLWIDPVNLTMDIQMELVLVPDTGPDAIDVDGDGAPDTKILDVTVGQSNWSWDANGDDIQFQNCGVASLINDINDVLGLFGLDLYDTLLGVVEPEIDSLITELPAEIEPLLEDAFAGLVISEQLDLLGTPLDLTLWPDTLELEPSGMRLGLATYIDVPVHECVAKYDIGASLATPAPPPDLSHAGAPFPPALVALLDDDFVNHILFAAWSGGLLCFDLGDGALDLPIPIDTGLLELMAPGVFSHLFPETAPMGLVTDPRQPPILNLTGANDLNIIADPLGLTFTVDLDGRRTRLMNIDLAADIGVDIDYDAPSGALAIGIQADAGAITPTVTFNEYVPEATPNIEASFTVLFDALIGPLLGGIAGDLAFPIPGFEIGDTDNDGISEFLGLTSLELLPAGSDNTWAAGYAGLGVTSGGTGCDAEGGCDTSGCSSGCTSTGGLPSQMLLLFPLLVAGLRRRGH